MLVVNLDLLTVGITVAAILILGAILYLSDRNSVTHRTFLYLALLASSWSIANYLSYQSQNEQTTLWLIRLVMFSAVWFAFYLLKLLYVFPGRNGQFLSKTLRNCLYAWTTLISVSTLTPLLFSGVSGLGTTAKPIVSYGIIPFGFTTFFFLATGIFLLIKKTYKAHGIEKRQYLFVSLGTFCTFTLIFIFNFLLPSTLNNASFVPFGALFIFPFVALTSYAIIKHGLLNIKVVTTEILTFILAVVTFIEIIFADDLAQIIFRSGIFVLVMIFGILLIKSVRREIEQREKIEVLAKELTKVNERLKELDKQKTEFLSIASHQLRAPLTAIKGYSSLILEHSFGEISDRVRGAVDVIFQSSQKLVTVIEDFLNITRIELGKMKYEMGLTDLRKLVEEAARELGPQIEKRGLALNVDIPEGLSFIVTADAGKIAQVIGNLIDNATKYTKEGLIKITLSRPIGVGKVRLAIADTGVGLTPGAHAKLFEKFIRARDASKTNIIGTGLGLYVAKQIVEAHGGRIWAESPGPGRGSTFYVEL